MIVNEKERALALDYENEASDVETMVNGKLVIFTNVNCQKCALLTNALLSDRTPHLTFNINEDPVLYRQFMSYIQDSLTAETRIRFPVIWNKDHTIFGYEDLEELLAKLK